MTSLSSQSVDFILTDPPYLVNRSREGQRIANDNNSVWLEPAFREMFRLLKPGSVCLSFYGWNHLDLFIAGPAVRRLPPPYSSRRP